MRDDNFDGIRFDQSYDFGLPRLGLTWTPSPSLEAFAAWAYSSREPAFRDLYDGEAVGNLPLYGTIDVPAGIYEDPLIHPEHVNDFELNGAWHHPHAALTATLFRMNFRDELVYAGQFNTDLGYPILGNAAKSVHQGIELAGRVEHSVAAVHRLALDANVTLSDHHFVSYQEVYGTAPGDTFHYDGNTIGFFPQVLANLGGRWSWRWASLGADVQHVGRIYLDNTEQREASIAPRTVLDLTGGVRTRAGGAPVEIVAHLFNVLDKQYETGGYMDYDASGALAPFRTPAAGRNVLVELRVGSP
jgi:outer membrane receptor protein involved in Fe transport